VVTSVLRMDPQQKSLGYRVHGGGFAGTVQAFVPFEMLDAFRAGVDGVLGEGACQVLSIRPQGGAEMTAQF